MLKQSIMTTKSPGWEPIFEFEGQTLAEMSADKKVWKSRINPAAVVLADGS